MPHKERMAWVWLTTLLLCMGTYFAAVVVMKELRIELSFLQQIGLLAAATSTMAVVVLADRLIARFRGRGRKADAGDERDRLIEYRAATIAYYVLIAGMILVGCIMPLDPTQHPWDIVNAALFYIVLAEAVKLVLIVRGYRRGLHV
ncbi:MAG: hypothetical protein JSR34_08180 [Proteobacteria bacterium]|nr:hypothetical protein [Pseudomonadota bacterium]